MLSSRVNRVAASTEMLDDDEPLRLLNSVKNEVGRTRARILVLLVFVVAVFATYIITGLIFRPPDWLLGFWGLVAGVVVLALFSLRTYLKERDEK
jgi:uncharacterized PurR-regulated membrane protein YhhQ (DUF165 family)